MVDVLVDERSPDDRRAPPRVAEEPRQVDEGRARGACGRPARPGRAAARRRGRRAQPGWIASSSWRSTHASVLPSLSICGLSRRTTIRSTRGAAASRPSRAAIVLRASRPRPSNWRDEDGVTSGWPLEPARHLLAPRQAARAVAALEAGVAAPRTGSALRAIERPRQPRALGDRSSAARQCEAWLSPISATVAAVASRLRDAERADGDDRSRARRSCTARWARPRRHDRRGDDRASGAGRHAPRGSRAAAPKHRGVRRRARASSRRALALDALVERRAPARGEGEHERASPPRRGRTSRRGAARSAPAADRVLDERLREQRRARERCHARPARTAAASDGARTSSGQCQR